MTPGSLLSPQAVADRWGVRKSHVYRLTRSGHLKAVQLGRYYRYRIEDLEAFESAGGTSAKRHS